MPNPKIELSAYLGGGVQDLLSLPPFSAWKVTRSVEEELPEKEVYYEFEGHGVEIICDEAERIGTIFLHRGDGEALSPMPFSLSRKEVLARFGPPSKSSGPVHIPVLGERGAWDRFMISGSCLHVKYALERDEVEGVTFMTLSSVP